MSKRGFSLLEVMVAFALTGVIAATVVASFKGSVDEQARSKHEWQAFTIAQQQMELLMAVAKSSSTLDGDASAAIPGTTADRTCADATATNKRRVNELGIASAGGAYELCWKIKNGSPVGTLKNIRVVVTYPSGSGTGNVYVQAIR